MTKIIIADAGPLIAFSRIEQLLILKKLFGNVLISEAVAKECLVDMSLPGASYIQKALNQKTIKACSDPNDDQIDGLPEFLGKGETTAIILAHKLKVPLLIDERLGRRVAKKLQIKIIGSAGILLLAKEKKLIKEVRPLIEQLKKANYHLSNLLVSQILNLANEN